MLETQNIPFWPLLDHVGVDLYIPFMDPRKPNASLILQRSEMVAFFTFVLNNRLMSWWANSSARVSGLRLLVTESGYPSANEGMRTPWLSASAGCVKDWAMNVTAQAAAFSVMFEVLSRHPTEFGGFVQFYYGSPGDKDDYYGDRHEKNSTWPCGWTPVGKNASMQVLAGAYRRR